MSCFSCDFLSCSFRLIDFRENFVCRCDCLRRSVLQFEHLGFTELSKCQQCFIVIIGLQLPRTGGHCVPIIVLTSGLIIEVHNVPFVVFDSAIYEKCHVTGSFPSNFCFLAWHLWCGVSGGQVTVPTASVSSFCAITCVSFCALECAHAR